MAELKIQQWPLERLRPYVNNPRKNEKAVKKVAESIRMFGFNVPITVDKDGVIATGHTRLKAAILLGLKEVPVIVLDELTPEQINAWRLVDNQVAEIAEWDFPKLQEELLKIKNIDLSAFDFKNPDESTGLHEDNYEVSLPKEPKAKPGDVYVLGNHRIMCGDSTKMEDLNKLTKGKPVDLLVTDPPYNVDIQITDIEEAKKRRRRTDGLGVSNDALSDEDFKKLLVQVFSNIHQLLKSGGVFYVWYATSESSTFHEAANESGLTVRQEIIWKKNTLVLGRQDYQWIHEPCLYGWKEGAGHYFINDRGFTTVVELDKSDLSKMSKPDLIKLINQLKGPKEATTVIEEDKPAKNPFHPTMKPIRLIGRLIANSSTKGQAVIDPFGGSGSTLIAAEQLGRVCYMMELDPHYVDVIIDRWEKYTGQKARRVNEDETI